MIYARRNKLPDRVKVNKSGGISVLSFVRHLQLPDDVEFEVEVIDEGETKGLIFRTQIVVPADNVQEIPETSYASLAQRDKEGPFEDY